MTNVRSTQGHASDRIFAHELHIKAPAKVNLSLHIKGRRPDGYHELGGLVAFADIADELLFKQEEHADLTDIGLDWSLSITGPFSANLDNGGEGSSQNLVEQAARLFQKENEGCAGGEIILQKNLPIAAGIGGGSSDAAATLNALQKICRSCDDEDLKDMAMRLGADVAMCLSPEAKMIAGIGELYQTATGFTPLPAILVNPGVKVPTPQVFTKLSAPALLDDLPEVTHEIFRQGDISRLSIIDWLRTQGNDLQAPAIRIAPVIKDVLAVIGAEENCHLARMSGSGATCFGLYDSLDIAKQAARRISTQHPDWWVVATMLR